MKHTTTLAALVLLASCCSVPVFMPVAAAEGLIVEERTYTLAEAMAADEAFITGASSYVEPVAAIDGVLVGDGGVGPWTRRLRVAYLADVRTRLL